MDDATTGDGAQPAADLEMAFVREYLNMTHDAVEKDRYIMNCWASDPSPYVTPETMSRAELLFRKAEAAVADDLGHIGRLKQPLGRIYVARHLVELRLHGARGLTRPRFTGDQPARIMPRLQ